MPKFTSINNVTSILLCYANLLAGSSVAAYLKSVFIIFSSEDSGQRRLLLIMHA